MPGRVCARALDGARAGLGRPGRRKTAGGLMALQALLNTPLALRPAAAQALIAAAARTDAGLTLDMQARSAEAGYMVIEQACSAAYALASSADVVTVPRTGTTGSIGILYLHVDVSRAQRDAGLN